MSENKEKNVGRITTPKFRASFANVFEPKANLQGKLKFSVVMLFEKSVIKEGSLKDLQRIVKQAALDKWGEIPAGLILPFKDGDTKDYEGYKDKIFAQAASEYSPAIVDTGDMNNNIKPQAILDKTEFYSGCYARASVTAYAWENMGRKGVSIGLQNLQKLGDGEPFSGRGNPEDDFDPIVPEDIGVADTGDLFGDMEDGEGIDFKSKSKDGSIGVEGL